MNLSDLHDCEKCRGKLVMIESDYLGITRCGYCREIVDYTKWLKREFITKDIDNKTLSNWIGNK